MSKKYTSDDNRSMQLNPNNERYASSRGIGDDEDYDKTLYKVKEIECDNCQTCLDYFRTGSWVPCLHPKKLLVKRKS
jgi:hypothetical protein